jgi:hypothetical protein
VCIYIVNTIWYSRTPWTGFSSMEVLPQRCRDRFQLHRPTADCCTYRVRWRLHSNHFSAACFASRGRIL